MSIYDFKVKKRDWSDLDLGSLKWKVVIVVNTATWCGFVAPPENLRPEYHNGAPKKYLLT